MNNGRVHALAREIPLSSFAFLLAYHGKQKFDSVEAVDVKCYAQTSALHSAQDDALREASHRITVRVRTIP